MSSRSRGLKHDDPSQRVQLDHVAAEEGRFGEADPDHNTLRRSESRQSQGNGLLKMVTYQSDDSTYRLVQDSAAAASAVSWGMQKRTQEAFESFAQQYVDQDDQWMDTLESEVRPRVLEQYRFLQSRIAVESLEEPGDAAFARFRICWEGLKADGFIPAEEKSHWRRLSKPPAHEDLAREALASSPPWLKKVFWFTRVGSERNRDLYNGTVLARVMAVAVIIVTALLSSVPVILLAMEVVGSMGGRLALIVSSNAILMIGLVLSGVQPGIALGFSMAYSAVMVNVDV